MPELRHSHQPMKTCQTMAENNRKCQSNGPQPPEENRGHHVNFDFEF
jgi:hypothetical protein